MLLNFSWRPGQPPDKEPSSADVSGAEAENPALCSCSEHSTSDTSVIPEPLGIGHLESDWRWLLVGQKVFLGHCPPPQQ